MKRRVGLIDYGSAGNTESVRRALVAAGAEVKMIRSTGEFESVSHYVLPGVGSFSQVMEGIRANGMEAPLRQVARSKPTLGICLGMQILSTLGFECGETRGLGLIDGEVSLMRCRASMPHIGFNRIDCIMASPIFAGIGTEAEFYFMHSYEFVNYTNVCALSCHGGHRFVSAVQKNYLFGVQFHPEKSRENGIRLLKNFIEL